jgi:hypothetical protein
MFGMPPSSRHGNIPICVASETHLCRRKQLVNTAAIKADDDLVTDDDRRRTAALVCPNQLLKGRRVHRDIALDKIDAFLRKILFRAMAGTSAIHSIYFDCFFSHLEISPFLGQNLRVRIGCV